MSNKKIILEGCINSFKEINELTANTSEVFEIFSLNQIFKYKNISHENIINSIVDGGNDGGIDSVIVFVNDEVIENLDEIENFSFNSKTQTNIIITQCKKENSFKETTIDKLITTIPVILDLEKNESALLSRFNSDLVNQVLLLIEVWKNTVIKGGFISIDYNYISNAPQIEINNVFEQKIEQLIDITKKATSSSEIQFTLYSCKELLDLYQKQKSNRLSLEFKDRPLTIDYNDGIGYIGTVKLNTYKEFLTSESGSIRDDLFESNIRHFQGLVDVNKKIKESVENVTVEDFWWLNNGITIIAEEPKEVGKKLSIENIQIVNGLQSSYSIFNNHSIQNDDRSVLVKIIINNNKEIVDNIIASTNSQNPVSPTLLRATEPIQRNLELFFLNEGFYYDRRKNYYKNQNKPSTKIFGIQFTAQSIESIIFNNPHSARSTPTALLKNESNYNRIFNESNDFKGYLNCCLINKRSHLMWSNYQNTDIRNKTSNFKLHLASILPKFVMNKAIVNFGDIVSLNVENINQEIFDQSINFLNNCITDYLEKRSGNLINIAKSGEFTDYLNSKIDEKYVS